MFGSVRGLGPAVARRSDVAMQRRCAAFGAWAGRTLRMAGADTGVQPYSAAANCSSITCWNTSNGCAPEMNTPLIRKAGVPRTPSD